MLSGKYDAESAYELAIDKVNKRIDDDSYLTFEARSNSDRQQQLVDLRKSLIDPNSPPAAGIVDEITGSCLLPNTSWESSRRSGSCSDFA